MTVAKSWKHHFLLCFFFPVVLLSAKISPAYRNTWQEQNTAEKSGEVTSPL